MYLTLRLCRDQAGPGGAQGAGSGVWPVVSDPRTLSSKERRVWLCLSFLLWEVGEILYLGAMCVLSVASVPTKWSLCWSPGHSPLREGTLFIIAPWWL